MCSIPELKPLELYIGTSEAQNAVVYPLDQLPHLLVCGMNGCGRSSFLRAQAAILAHGAPAEQLRLVLLDETGVEFVQFKELPHLLMPPVSAPERKAGAMLALCMELQWRYSVFAKCGARELEDYNQQAETPLPHIVAVIDGLEDLLAQKECVGQIQQICQKGRPAGIHIIAAARQVPEEEIIAGFASRLAFRVATKNAANRMGAPGAELLPIPGTALFSPINYANPVRVQTKELTDEEIEILIAPVATGHHYDDDFVREASRVESDEWPDPMYEYARQCVIEAGYASTSLLQRRCNLGYARAAHILDQLEQAKVIGPYEGAQPRVVLPPYAKPKAPQIPKAAPAAKGIKINRSTAPPVSAPVTEPAPPRQKKLQHSHWYRKLSKRSRRFNARSPRCRGAMTWKAMILSTCVRMPCGPMVINRCKLRRPAAIMALMFWLKTMGYPMPSSASGTIRPLATMRCRKPMQVPPIMAAACRWS